MNWRSCTWRQSRPRAQGTTTTLKGAASLPRDDSIGKSRRANTSYASAQSLHDAINFASGANLSLMSALPDRTIDPTALEQLQMKASQVLSGRTRSAPHHQPEAVGQLAVG